MTAPRRPFAQPGQLLPLLVLVAVSTLWSLPARGQGTHDIWTTDGNIYAVAQAGNVLYVGGFFSRIGPTTGCALLYDPNSAQPLLPTPGVAGTVAAVVADGAGGWYIGGNFTSVQRQPRNNLAHLDASGNVTAWNPNADAQVNALLRVGTTLYVGGSFTQVAGQGRAGLAAVDTAGVLKAWNPGVLGGAVNSLAARSTPALTIYAGGGFVLAGVLGRSRVAAFDSTGAVLPWNPNSNGIVYALAVSGGTVYLGGTFSTLNGGTGRSSIAAVDAVTGVLTGWNPGANSEVAALAIGGGGVYAGGYFTTAGGQPRNGIAAIDTTTGLATAWNPAPNAGGYVTALAVNGATVYAGGKFTQIGGQARPDLAALDATTGLASTWAPQPNDQVDAVAIGPTIFAGGHFTSNGGVARSNLAAIDLTTGHATAWNPGADNLVLSLLPSGGLVYAGGDFLHMGGQSHDGLAAVDAVTGAVRAWNPFVVGEVRTMTMSGGVLYIGGSFSFVGGQQRASLAAIDTSTAAPTAWHPATNGAVQTILISGGVAYVGGNFGTVGAGPTVGAGDSLRNDMAAFDAASGAPLAWNPNPGSNVVFTISALAASGGEIYVGGGYKTMGGQSRPYLSAVDPVTGLATAWQPNPDGAVNAIAFDGGVMYAGGAFTKIGTDAATRNRIAALDPATGATTTWDANAGSTVTVLTAHGGLVCAGGQFTTMTNRPSGRVAVITEATTGVSPAIPALTTQLGVAPNPSRGTVMLHFRVPAAGEGEVAMYDLRGRRVRVLARGTFPAGDQRLNWDGRDASGRRVASGIYFASVRVGAQRIVGRVLRLE
jgi:hypothetical protein